MGISTSGAALLVFAALLVSVGTLQGAAGSALGEVRSAVAAQGQQTRLIQETRLAVASAAFDAGTNTTTLTIDNVGDTSLRTAETSVLVDGQFVPLASFETVTVDGIETRRWGPTATLRLVDSDGSLLDRIDDATPDRVKIVAGTGVAAVTEVTPA